MRIFSCNKLQSGLRPNKVCIFEQKFVFGIGLGDQLMFAIFFGFLTFVTDFKIKVSKQMGISKFFPTLFTLRSVFSIKMTESPDYLDPALHCDSRSQTQPGTFVIFFSNNVIGLGEHFLCLGFLRTSIFEKYSKMIFE